MIKNKINVFINASISGIILIQFHHLIINVQ